jgi:hypothetical protein
MRQLLRAVVIGMVVASAAWPQPAEALFHQQQLRLTGCRGYLASKGVVTYTDSFGTIGTPDGQKLVIVVENVPLPPGTELMVYVHGNQVGTLKLDKQRNGRFVIGSNFRNPAPPITLGSFVVLKLDDGSNVMW